MNTQILENRLKSFKPQYMVLYFTQNERSYGKTDVKLFLQTEILHLINMCWKNKLMNTNSCKNSSVAQSSEYYYPGK